MKRARPRRAWLGRALAALTMLVLGVAGLPLLAPWLGRRSYLADLGTSLVPHAAIALALMLPLILWLRRPIPALLWMALATLAGWWLLALAPERSQTAPSREGLLLMSANLKIDNPTKAKAVAAIRATAPDLLLVQESSYAWRIALDELSDLLPYNSSPGIRSYPPTVIYSRWPLRQVEIVPLITREQTHGLSNLVIRAEIERDGIIVELFDVHAPTPRSPDLWAARNDYLNKLASLVRTVPPGRPILLAGDFNTPYWSPWYRSFIAASGLRDVAPRGWPPATRLPIEFGLSGRLASWLGVPIDHVLVSSEIAAGMFAPGPDLGSDHLPVLVQLTLPPALGK